MGQAYHVSLAVNPRLLEGRLFHNLRSRDLAHPGRSSEAELPSAMVWRRFLPLWKSQRPIRTYRAVKVLAVSEFTVTV